MLVQLDFFKDEKEIEIDGLKQQVKEMDTSLHKVRKGLFAKHGDLAKLYLDLLNRLEILEKNICKKE